MQPDYVTFRVVSQSVRVKDYLDDTIFIVPDPKVYKPSREVGVASSLRYQHIYMLIKSAGPSGGIPVSPPKTE
jgi:hypothetical protein